MVSPQQMSALMDFLEKHPVIAQGYHTRTTEGRHKSARLWTACGKILNSLSPDGMVKTGDSWRIFFNEFKSRTLRRVRMIKSDLEVPGSKKLTLSWNQRRLYELIGGDVGELDVCQKPVTQQIVEQHYHKEHKESPSILSNSVIFSHIPVEEGSSGTVEIQSLSPQSYFSISPTIKEEVSDPLVVEIPPVVATPPQPRRRRRLVPRSHLATDPDLSSAIDALVAMKRRRAAVNLKQASASREQASALREQASAISEHAQAVRGHAAAINRLAAALETIGPHFITK